MFRKIKDARALWKALGYYENIRKEADMDSKNILLSKTFWANIAGIAVTVAGVLPQEYAVPVLAIGNIILRLVTNKPVNLWK